MTKLVDAIDGLVLSADVKSAPMRQIDKLTRQQPTILVNHLRVVREHGGAAHAKIAYLKDMKSCA